MGSDAPFSATKRYTAWRQSHFLTQSYGVLVRNFLIVFLISSLVWCLCSFLRFCVELGVRYLFDPIPYQKPYAVFILLAVISAGGLLRGLILQIPSWKSSEGDGLDTAFMNFRNSIERSKVSLKYYRKKTIKNVLQRVIMTILTLGTGGSGGLAAPVLSMGQQLSSWVSSWFLNIKRDELQLFQMAGVTAAICTLIDAPFTAVIFSMEVLISSRVIYHFLVYSFFSSILSYSFNNYFLAFKPLFHIQAHNHQYSLLEYAQVAFVAALISVPAGLGLRWIFHSLYRLSQSIPLPYRPILAAFSTGLIALLMWEKLGIEPRHVLGIGEESIKELFAGNGNPLLRVWWVLILIVVAKTLTTGLTLMSGGSAGLLVPSMLLGGFSGASIYQFLEEIGVHTGPNANLFIVSGIASSLVAVLDVPLAAICFVIEVFGSHYGPAAIVSVVLCHMMVHRLRLYSNSTVLK